MSSKPKVNDRERRNGAAAVDRRRSAETPSTLTPSGLSDTFAAAPSMDSAPPFDSALTPPLERRRGGDRRQHERVLVDWSVDYRAKDTFLFAYISDISAMGIFVRTQEPESPGTRLNLRFSPPGSEPLELEGQVTWINQPRDSDDESRQAGMGIQFVDLTAHQRDQLLRLVRTFAYLDDEEEEARGHS